MLKPTIKELKEIRERILVVDDERRICDSLSALLNDSGFEVATFQDSDEAAREIRSGHFDMIITDIKMPGLSGLEILRLARAQPKRSPFSWTPPPFPAANSYLSPSFCGPSQR